MKYIFSWKIVSLYSLFIAALSIYHFPETPDIPISFFDKIIHFSMYLVLSFITAKTLFLKNKKNYFLYGFLYAFTLGLLLEIAQFFIPYRGFELNDIFSNFLGSAAGTMLTMIKGTKYA